MSKIVKLSIIRKEGLNSCPYGLNIPFGCLNIGELEKVLIPIDPNLQKEQQQKIIEFNIKNLQWYSQGKPCTYLHKIFKEKESVECGFDQNGVESNLVGSPFYAKFFSGTALDGLYSVPLGSYVDNSIDRGHYYGMYSIESIAEENSDNENIKKSSNK